MSTIDLQMKGYRLTTAEILYHMPDHPEFLQTFIWQQFDLAPRYPVLRKFLQFWHENLDGPLHSVRVAAKEIITPSDLTHADMMATLH